MRSAKIAMESAGSDVRLVNPSMIIVLHKLKGGYAPMASICSWTDVNPHFEYDPAKVEVCAATPPFKFSQVNETAGVLLRSWFWAHWFVKEMER